MAIDLSTMEDELIRMRRKLSDWSTARTQLATERKDHHVAFCNDQADKLKQLKALQAQLKVAAEQTRKRLTSEEEEAKRTEEKLTLANSEVSTSERRQETAKAQLKKRQEDYRQRLEELEKVHKESQQCADKLLKDAEFFAECFGLRFRMGQGDLAVVMTHIDPRDHEKEFSVAVRVEDKMYTVTKCEPLVPDLDSLLREVNKTNDFGAFVKAVRARFVAMTSES